MIQVTTSTIPTIASGKEIATIAVVIMIDTLPFYPHPPSRRVPSRC